MRRRLVLTAPRVYLRPPLDRDWRDWSLLRARSRKFLERWEPTWAEDAVSRAAYQNRLDFYRRLARRGSGLALHIFRREDDALVGGLTLNNIRRGIVQSCNVGYWIGEEYAHRGYMTEALAATIAYVFDQLRLHRLEAACLPENERSRGLLLKLGFREEGHARAYLKINGAWRDHVLYALVADDWRAMQASADTQPPENTVQDTSAGEGAQPTSTLIPGGG